MDFSNKKLMILGAGRHQVPLIQAAVDLGVEAHVCSIQGDYPGIGLGSYFHDVDVSDMDAVLQLARSILPDGIITTATDVCLRSIGLVVDVLNLSGSGLEASSSCLDKVLMKKNLMDAGVPTAQYQVVDDVESAIEFFNQQSSFCVLKPADSSGSRGVSKVTAQTEIPDAFLSAQNFSRRGVVLIEEWLEGEEFGAQAVVRNNRCEILVVHSDVTTAPPRRIPIGHGCPHEDEVELLSEIRSMVDDAIASIGINNTISNIDFIMTEDGPKIIELTCRMGGTRLPEVCGTYWGINFYALAIQLALNFNINLPSSPQGKPNAAHNIILPQSGVLESVDNINQEFVHEIYYNNGDYVAANAAQQAELGYIQSIRDDASSIMPDLLKEVKRITDSVTFMEE